MNSPTTDQNRKHAQSQQARGERERGQMHNAWMTPHGAGLFTLSLESTPNAQPYELLSVRTLQFPKREDISITRHTMVIGLLTRSDLRRLRDILDEHLDGVED